ncbi:hypothetical protein KV203_09090 [Skermania piniformis]|uniref:Uncharacterized protein n=1 Tax=Skermania pinensis TaxID=39122 RepID=A0ABX8SFR4_9ACTN|nr:hypothetical protein KV203_09090 [Skermania piniformis]
MLITVATLVGPAAATLLDPTAAAAAPTSSAACGTPLRSGEVAEIIALSDVTTLSGAPLDQLTDGIARNDRIATILASRQDRRGLFAVGLDAVEQRAVLPLQRNPAAFADPAYGRAISLDLLRRWLHNVHLEFTGGVPERHWAHYFAVARQCTESGGYVAMTGYNAHLVVDLARSVAAVGGRPENAGDYFTIVDAIATHGQVVVDATRAAYDVDLGPLWRFYFVGAGLDQLTGTNAASQQLLRFADLGANVVILGNGIALADPATAGAAEIEIDMLWQTVDLALLTLSRSGGI